MFIGSQFFTTGNFPQTIDYEQINSFNDEIMPTGYKISVNEIKHLFNLVNANFHIYPPDRLHSCFQYFNHQ